MLRKVEETPTASKKSQVLYDKDTVIQLPRVTGGQNHGKWSARRSDFTEIEIPGSLPPHKPSCDSQRELPSPVSSYQLFPGPDVSPNTQQRHSTSNPSLPLQSYKNNMDSVLSVKKVPNSYMNHSIFLQDVPLKEKVRKDYHKLNQGQPMPMRNGPKPYKSTRVPIHTPFVPWTVEQPTAAAGDNSLTALQIAKSLSEVDFQPVDRQYQYHQVSPRQRYQACDFSLASERSYGWEKEVSWVVMCCVANTDSRVIIRHDIVHFNGLMEMCQQVSVLHGAPETVWELLSTLGLQRYTLDLSRNGWDDLDYFR